MLRAGRIKETGVDRERREEAFEDGKELVHLNALWERGDLAEGLIEDAVQQEQLRAVRV